MVKPYQDPTRLRKLACVPIKPITVLEGRIDMIGLVSILYILPHVSVAHTHCISFDISVLVILTDLLLLVPFDSLPFHGTFAFTSID